MLQYAENNVVMLEYFCLICSAKFY